MTYWLVLSTVSWAMSFATYPDLATCQAAAKDAPWYVTATCVPKPPQHTH